MADLVRTVAALLLASVLAPVLFVVLLWAAVALDADASLSRSAPSSINELVGLLLVALVLGSPVSICATLLVGLPGIYVARRLHLTSIWVYGVAGSFLAVCCTAWFAREAAGSGRLTGWFQFAAFSALTGAFSGLLCRLVAERPRRIEREGLTV